MAPELIGELKPYNNKVDIWALACLWYQLITKRDLFPGIILLITLGRTI